MTEGDREPPGWLRDLAATAAVMEVPEVARPPASGGRSSAVLVLFGDGVRGPDLLYIQRSEGLRRHPGQPAFPGGKIEESDDGPVAAALREAVEETGLDPAGVDVLTTLPEMFIARSEFRVVPVLGWWRTPSAVRPTDIGEVAAVERIARGRPGRSSQPAHDAVSRRAQRPRVPHRPDADLGVHRAADRPIARTGRLRAPLGCHHHPRAARWSALTGYGGLRAR